MVWLSLNFYDNICICQIFYTHFCIIRNVRKKIISEVVFYLYIFTTRFNGNNIMYVDFLFLKQKHVCWFPIFNTLLIVGCNFLIGIFLWFSNKHCHYSTQPLLTKLQISAEYLIRWDLQLYDLLLLLLLIDLLYIYTRPS